MKTTYYPSQIIDTNNLFEGETLEQKVRKLESEKQPIESVSPEIFTEKKDGVLPQFDIRTDRWDIAQQAMDAVAASQIAKSEKGLDVETDKGKSAEPEPLQADNGGTGVSE